ncbi:hypothetical protein GCM10010349_64810 [Streptomyces flavofungini]|nr:hypothetical protein GCM10010349_64810 [Streptomyces flavofungini]
MAAAVRHDVRHTMYGIWNDFEAQGDSHHATHTSALQLPQWEERARQDPRGGRRRSRRGARFDGDRLRPE